VNGARYIFATLPFRHQADHFRFRENGAHGGEGYPVFTLKSGAAEIRKVETESVSHEFQEFPGSGGALVVHLESGNPAVLVQGDGFGVLAADVQDAPCAGTQFDRSLGMGLYFAERRNLETYFRKRTSVTGGGQAASIA